jgi:hypothetical protein
MNYACSPALRRLALVAAAIGATIAATPALANASSTCTYSPDAFPAARVDVFDGSQNLSLRMHRKDQFIAITDGGGTKLCSGPAGSFATRFNTDQIVVHGTSPFAENGGAFLVDQSAGELGPGRTPEPDGNSEIETLIDNNGVRTNLTVIGTNGPDTMRVSSGGGVMLGPDNDVDIRFRDATQVRLDGAGGNDYVSGRGGYPASSPAPATTPVLLTGADGDDTLVDGPQPFDQLGGNDGNDTLYSVDGQQDRVHGGAGFDTATIDKQDLQLDAIERLTQADVGRLKLDRTVLTIRAGRSARITLAWRHPKGWKQLRSLMLTANDGGDVGGSIRIDPTGGRISGHGALEAARGSKVAHHGKWVTAHLRLRAAKPLAGRTLRLAVLATDAHGHQQIEPSAGSLTVVQ